MELYNKATRIKPAQHLAKEIEEGNHEYKFKLTNLTDVQINHRITQLQWRLNEGNNEAFYHIGVEDNGNPLGLTEEEMDESLKNLQYMADQAGCDMCVRQLYSGERGLVAEVVMTRKERLTVDTIHLTVTVAGDLDSGKSTTIGVLSSGLLDNGKGLARTRVFLHNHEIETGRTSCVSHTVLHFDKDGEVLNAEGTFGNAGAVKKHHRVRALSDLELADETTRSVTLIDLAGHPKYLKTTVHGMLGRKPDYGLICISMTAGIQSMTFEHVHLCLSLNVPLVVVITKVDTLAVPYRQVTSHPHFQKLVTALDSLFPDDASYSFPLIESKEQLIHLLSPSEGNSFLGTATSDGTATPRLTVPVFAVSNTTGEGLVLLRNLLYQLPDLNKATGRFEMENDLIGMNDCQGELLLKSGNYIRVLGSIGCVGSDEDNDNDNEEDSDLQEEEDLPVTSTSLEGQLLRIQEELCGIVFAEEEEESTTVGDVEEVVNTPHSIESVSAEEATEAYLQHHDQIDRYKSALTQLSAFVDLSPVRLRQSIGGGTSTSTTANTNSSNSNSNTKILIGKVISGKLQVMDELYFGPTLQGDFIPVVISSIRLNNVPVRYATAGQTATFRLMRVQQRRITGFEPLVITSNSVTPLESHGTKRRNNSSGLVLMSSQLEPHACLEFEAEICVINHRSKIRVNYEPVIHVGAVRQTGKILAIQKLSTVDSSEENLEEKSSLSQRRESPVQPDTGGETPQQQLQQQEVGNGETAIMRFKFLYHPELITIGETIILREDRMKGRGKIVKIIR